MYQLQVLHNGAWQDVPGACYATFREAHTRMYTDMPAGNPYIRYRKIQLADSVLALDVTIVIG